MKIIDEITAFLLPFREGQSVQWTAFLGAVAIATALIVPPILDNAAKTYADNRAFGIDRVITGSVEESRRYTVRKSILDDAE